MKEGKCVISVCVCLSISFIHHPPPQPPPATVPSDHYRAVVSSPFLNKPPHTRTHNCKSKNSKTTFVNLLPPHASPPSTTNAETMAAFHLSLTVAK
ncbi:hypothetical protein QL285_043609 [Trifolium repens]|nr:hypothetical protein QL285_043609 [Trifolium repens]